jgi:CRP-like cAMP-binding protein
MDLQFAQGGGMAKTDAETDWLARVSLFQGVPRRQLAAIRDSMRERSFHQGDVVVAEGEQEGRFYLITSGQATATVNDAEVAAFGPGDYFGEISLIDGGARTATIRADTQLETLTLAPFTFRPMLETHPEIAYAILVEMCRRVREADKRTI